MVSGGALCGGLRLSSSCLFDLPSSCWRRIWWGRRTIRGGHRRPAPVGDLAWCWAVVSWRSPVEEFGLERVRSKSSTSPLASPCHTGGAASQLCGRSVGAGVRPQTPGGPDERTKAPGPAPASSGTTTSRGPSTCAVRRSKQAAALQTVGPQ